MKVYFRDVGNWRGHHWSCKKKYRIFWVILLLFIIFSGYYLLPEKSTDHDLGFASLELSQKESTKGNIIRIDFVNKDGEITYAIDRRYATLLRTKNEDGQIIQDQYLDENGMPTNCYGYYKIKYTYNGNKKIIMFQDSDGKPANLESGYSSIIRTFNKNGQIIQDLYFDSEMNAVPSVGGYYGIYRKYNSQGLNYESIYINAEGFPMTNTSGYAKEQYIFDENNCKIKQFYFDVNSKPVQSILNLYAIVHGEEQADLSAWKAAPKKSLCSGFNDADPDAIIAWNRRMADLVAMDEIAKAIRNKVPAAKLRKMKSLTKIQKEWLERRIKKADFSEKMRLHYYLGVILDDEDEVQECFRTIQSEVLASTIKNLSYNENARIVTEKHTVKLPLRVNWGGGWSDTPPYCNENGGTVLNVAILLNGQKPVEVTLEKISEKKIVFDSRDMDVHGEFDTIEPLQATGDPFDPFALQKACLLACEIIPKEGSSLEEILDRLGGGFEMHSEVTNVPKGSGLGTSSILSAACVKAVFEFMGIAYTEEDLYAHVLAMEQIMSTGGGWQDQVGGITPGLKYITSMPGIDQKLKVTHVEIPEAAKQELSDRFVLIYTGQRRLARNLLRDVVGRYVGNEPESLFALEEIQKTAVLMRFELERGNVDGFASLLDYHWELSKKVDAGSSNTLIEQIFSSIEELIDGKLVCGAGGGGFLQVILKKGVTRQQVEERLNEVFMDSLVGVADCRLVWE